MFYFTAIYSKICVQPDCYWRLDIGKDIELIIFRNNNFFEEPVPGTLFINMQAFCRLNQASLHASTRPVNILSLLIALLSTLFAIKSSEKNVYFKI